MGRDHTKVVSTKIYYDGVEYNGKSTARLETADLLYRYVIISTVLTEF